MEVGRRLKQFRLLLGKSQDEFVAGIISESYYSKIERGKSNIKIGDLLAILDKNYISLNDFFKEF